MIESQKENRIDIWKTCRGLWCRKTDAPGMVNRIAEIQRVPQSLTLDTRKVKNSSHEIGSKHITDYGLWCACCLFVFGKITVKRSI